MDAGAKDLALWVLQRLSRDSEGCEPAQLPAALSAAGLLGLQPAEGVLEALLEAGAARWPPACEPAGLLACLRACLLACLPACLLACLPAPSFVVLLASEKCHRVSVLGGASRQYASAGTGWLGAVPGASVEHVAGLLCGNNPLVGRPVLGWHQT
jgi:hypothetical protein